MYVQGRFQPVLVIERSFDRVVSVPTPSTCMYSSLHVGEQLRQAEEGGWVGAPVAPCLASYGGQELRSTCSVMSTAEERKKKKGKKKIFPSIISQPSSGNMPIAEFGRCM